MLIMLITASGFNVEELDALQACLSSLGGHLVEHGAEINICKRADQQNPQMQNVTENWVKKCIALKCFVSPRRFKPILHGINVHLLQVPKKIVQKTSANNVPSGLADVTITNPTLVEAAKLCYKHPVVTPDWVEAVKRCWVSPKNFVCRIKPNFQLSGYIFFFEKYSNFAARLVNAGGGTYLKKKLDIEGLVIISDREHPNCKSIAWLKSKFGIT